jgi:Xaa-Pro aminopeptidase
LIISDMVPCLDGYWADSCSTFAVGGVVTDQARAMHAIAREAFERGFEAIRPGITGDELATIVQGAVRGHGYDYWHHTGHGVGVSNHEEPRITPGSATVLAPNMVVLLEPGVYVEGFGGCRQERMIRVTDDGAELMTNNPLTLV